MILIYNMTERNDTMKSKKFTALLMTMCMLFAGCGRTGNINSQEKEPSTEQTVLVTETAVQEIFTEADTTEAVTTTTAAETTAVQTSTVTSSQAYTTENNTYDSNEDTDNATQEVWYEETQNDEVQNEAPLIIVTTAVRHTTMKKTTAKKVTTTTTTTHAVTPQEVMEKMTLEQKVCQMFMVTPEAITGITPMREVGNGTKNAMLSYPVGGIIYFAQNLISRDQIKTMIANTQSFSKEACGVGLFIAVDEEGGTVARCAQKLGTTAFKNMAYYGSSNDYKTAYNIGNTLGKDLRGLGFNVDFAPVADVDICSGNELGDRIFSSDPNVVANMVCGVSKGLQDNGVCATLKHFPGLGAEDGNTHTNSTVVIDRTIEQLRETEFIPFKKAIDSGADLVMVGHQTVTGLEDGLPCDLSYVAVTELLRNELGFNGLAVTDAHQMNTISTVYSSGEAAKLSIKAGMDIILMPVDYREAVEAVCEAVRSGEIAESRIDESVMRILDKKQKLGLLK